MDIVAIIVFIEKLVQDMREIPWFTLSKIFELNNELEIRIIALKNRNIDKKLFPIASNHIDELKNGLFQGIKLNNTDFDAGDGSMSLSNILDDVYQPTLEYYWKLDDNYYTNSRNNDNDLDDMDNIDNISNINKNNNDDDFFVCVICNGEYNDNSPGMLCDNDDHHWYHQGCLDMTHKEMEEIVDSGEHWDCPVCKENQYLEKKTEELLKKRDKILNNNANTRCVCMFCWQ